MKVKEQTIRELAELLLCGQLCYVNIKTGTFEHHPMQMDYFMDEENPWQEVMDKLEQNREDYIRIEPMDATKSFAVMEDFSERLPPEGFRNRLLTALRRPKPFRNFNHIIHESEFRQEWFDFREERNIEWVKEQLSSTDDMYP